MSSSESAFLLVRTKNMGCFLLYQRFRKFRSEIKWKGQFRFLPTGILGITTGGVHSFQLEYSDEIRRSIFNKPVLCLNSYLLGRFNRKMSFHFPSVFPLISDRSVWHNGKHPWILATFNLCTVVVKVHFCNR